MAVAATRVTIRTGLLPAASTEAEIITPTMAQTVAM